MSYYRRDLGGSSDATKSGINAPSSWRKPPSEKPSSLSRIFTASPAVSDRRNSPVASSVSSPVEGMRSPSANSPVLPNKAAKKKAAHISKLPLHQAASEGNFAECQRLLKADASEINQPDPDQKNKTPLHFAVFKQSEEADEIYQRRQLLVKFLLDQGANPALILLDSGDNSMHVAVTGRATEIVEILLRHPRKAEFFDLPNQKRRTPLSYAVANGYIDIIILLIHAGANLTVQDDKGRTLLHWLSGDKVAPLKSVLPALFLLFDVEFSDLVSLNLDSNHPDLDKMAQLLTETTLRPEMRALLTMTDSEGKTPIQYAEHCQQSKIKEILEYAQHLIQNDQQAVVLATDLFQEWLSCDLKRDALIQSICWREKQMREHPENKSALEQEKQDLITKLIVVEQRITALELLIPE